MNSTANESSMTRWWCEPLANQDAYAIYVVHSAGSGPRTYLNKEGQWTKYEPCSIIEPALLLSGALIHTLLRAGMKLDRHMLGESLAAQIKEAVENEQY